MFEFIDILLQKRRYFIVVAFVVIDVMLVSMLAPTMRAHQSDIMARIQASSARQAPQTYDSANAVTNLFSVIGDSAGRAANAVEVKTLRGAMAVTTGATIFDKDAARGARAAITIPAHIASVSAVFTAHAIGRGVAFTTHAVGSTFAFTFHTIGSGFGLIGHVIGGTFGFMGHGIGNGFGFAGRTFGNVFGFFGGITHVDSIIRPTDHTPTPTITELRAQQVSLIQKGTRNVSVAALTSGAGGACDAGDGNGGYPMRWCNASMDSIATVSYSNDPINRECTSYAYWYFTSIEGHAGLRVTGNAKYWASTSNYPTHAAPARGAIAVETAGAYGHVAIVQALPGQKYAGKVVPVGYVLVSEMNYDWNGHFRYSYSPLSKFSAYIYP